MENYQPGTIALFYDKGCLLTGIILGNEGANLILFDTDGMMRLLPSSRLCLTSTLCYSTADPQVSLDVFSQETAHVEIDATELAERLEFEGVALGLDEIAALTGLCNDPGRFALYTLLKSHKDLFNHKKDLFTVVSEQQRLIIKAEKARVDARNAFLHKARALISAVFINENAVVRDARDTFVDTFLEELRAVQRGEGDDDLIHLLHTQREHHTVHELIHQLRIALGDIPEDCDPILATAGIPVLFHQECVCEKIECDHDAEMPSAFAIDDEDTRDYDDAISLRKLGDNWLLGVHVSNVADCARPGSVLFNEARERVSSIYLPSMTASMLPPSISNQALSLTRHSHREVLSLYVTLDNSYNILEHQFRCDTIFVERNLSYSEADAMQDEEPLRTISMICSALASERGNGNHPDRDRYSYQLKYYDGKVVLKKVDNWSRSRAIVEELMILYNRLMAELGTQNAIPMVYRNISQFLDEDDPNAPVLGSQAYLSTDPGYHPGIGATSYLHASSPLRRFADLLNQAQVVAHLRGEKMPISRDDMQQHIPSIESRLRLHREVYRKSERYWLLRYLDDCCIGKPLDIQVIKKLPKGYLIDLLRWNKRMVLETDSQLWFDREGMLLLSQVNLDKLIAYGDVIY